MYPRRLLGCEIGHFALASAASAERPQRAVSAAAAVPRGTEGIISTPAPASFRRKGHHHTGRQGVAQRGKCSMGWFFGFKLYIVCNEKGELLNFMITPGDVDDWEAS